MYTRLIARCINALPPIVIATAAALAVWQIVVVVFAPPPFLVPTPAAVLAELVGRPAFYFGHLRATLFIMFCGYALAVVTSLIVALWFNEAPRVAKLLHPYVLGLQVTPTVALAPLLVLWLGIDTTAKVVIVALICFFPIFVSAEKGLRAVNPLAFDVFRSLNASWWQTLTKLRVPSSLPYVFPGLRIGMTLALSGAIVGEFIASSQGIGYVILLSMRIYDSTMLFAGLVALISAIGAIYATLVALERVVVFWQHGERDL